MKKLIKLIVILLAILAASQTIARAYNNEHLTSGVVSDPSGGG